MDTSVTVCPSCCARPSVSGQFYTASAAQNCTGARARHHLLQHSSTLTHSTTEWRSKKRPLEYKHERGYDIQGAFMMGFMTLRLPPCRCNEMVATGLMHRACPLFFINNIPHPHIGIHAYTAPQNLLPMRGKQIDSGICPCPLLLLDTLIHCSFLVLLYLLNANTDGFPHP